MVKPTPPTAPEAPLRSDPAFSAKAQTFLTWLAGGFNTYVGDAVDYVDERADEALAAATTFGFPSIAGKDLNFTRVNSGATALEFRTPAQVRSDIGASRGWTEVGPLSTSSGTAFDVTNIPDGVAEIVIMFNSVSLSGTDSIIVQLGAQGQALETVDYYSGRGTFSGTTIPTPGIVADEGNAGLVVRAGSATAGIVGVMSLVRGADVSQWFYTLLASIDGTTMQIGAGRKTLSAGRVDRFRVTRTGSNFFDQGFISARYR